jgi:putative pyruvate formate lyase activating enzyme
MSGDVFLPGYIRLHENGELAGRVATAQQMTTDCQLCPHRCRVDRTAGRSGACKSATLPKVASRNLHFWEEPPISGDRGSGTIFFSGCTGKCRFCQNYPISQLGVGQEIGVEDLAEMMLELQRRGAHNINFVTPTHFTAAILAALPHAVERGLRLPLAYNCSGYELVETLQLLEGVIDIWMPDAKYADDEIALRLSGFHDYVRHNRAALTEMYRQVGDIRIIDDQGVMQRGMIIRHLVLPDGLAGTKYVLEWIAGHLSPQVYISLMSQYFPAHLCVDDPVMGRKITPDEYEQAFGALTAAGFEDGWVQECGE